MYLYACKHSVFILSSRFNDIKITTVFMEVYFYDECLMFNNFYKNTVAC